MREKLNATFALLSGNEDYEVARIIEETNQMNISNFRITLKPHNHKTVYHFLTIFLPSTITIPLALLLTR